MYQLLENFAAGLDARKSPITAPAGTLTRLVNAVITPGGEIAKRRAFVNCADLTGTFGLAATSSTLYVFGKNTLPAVPAFDVDDVTLATQFIPTGDPALQQIDYDTFDGKVYLVCFSPAGVTPEAKNPHYYDGVLTEGSGKGYYVRTYQSKIYSINGKILWFSSLDNPLKWNDPPIVEVTITDISDGNPAVVTVATADLVNFTDDQLVKITGATGTGYINANGTWRITLVDNPVNTFTLPEVDTSAATVAYTPGAKAIPQSSALGNGFINLSLQDADSELLTSIEVYYDKLAIFSTEAVQIWAVDADPKQNAYVQLLRGTGTKAPQSAAQYGSGDVLYLDQSGIRSMKARDSSNAAASSDIGSPIDALIQDLLLSEGQDFMTQALTLLEPAVGRFWMVFPDRVFVLSHFPGPDITAWSQFNLPFVADYAVTCGGKVFIRSGVNLYVYGGPHGVSYDACGVEVRLPYLDGKKPGHKKMLKALDATVSGTWRIAISADFNNPDAEETVATLSFDPELGGGTWNAGASELTGYDSHFSLRFYNTDANKAVISNCAVHHELADDEA